MIEAIVEHRPDVAIVDVRLPPGFRDEGLRAALAARARLPGTPILILSQYVEPTYTAELLADGGGGVGYLKDRVSDVRDFLDALGRVAEGGMALDPTVVSRLLAPRAGAGTAALDSLSPREREVLGLMAEGRSNTAIATRSRSRPPWRSTSRAASASSGSSTRTPTIPESWPCSRTSAGDRPQP